MVVARSAKKIPVTGEVFQVRRASIVGSQGHSGHGTFPRVISSMASGMNMLPLITKKITLNEVPKNIIMLQTNREECKITAVFWHYEVDLAWAKKQIGDKMTIMGNLDCSRVLHLGSPDQVEEMCKKAIYDAAPGGVFWLSGGCEIPKDMSYTNMRRMVETCKKYGKYPIQK